MKCQISQTIYPETQSAYLGSTDATLGAKMLPPEAQKKNAGLDSQPPSDLLWQSIRL